MKNSKTIHNFAYGLNQKANIFDNSFIDHTIQFYCKYNNI